MISEDDLTQDELYDYHERAGIMEFDGGLTREGAEAEAMKMIMQRREANRLR